MRLQPPDPLTRPLPRSNWTCASLPGAMGSSPSCASRHSGPSIGSSRLMPLPQPVRPVVSSAAVARTGERESSEGRRNAWPVFLFNLQQVESGVIVCDGAGPANAMRSVERA
jgi:hypothetical protein